MKKVLFISIIFFVGLSLKAQTNTHSTTQNISITLRNTSFIRYEMAQQKLALDNQSAVSGIESEMNTASKIENISVKAKGKWLITKTTITDDFYELPVKSTQASNDQELILTTAGSDKDVIYNITHQ